MDLDPNQLQEQLQSAVASGGGASGFLAGFSFWTIFIGFVASIFGYWIFKQGRRKGNFGLIGIGIAMMVYPYFVTANAWLCFGIGAVLGFLAYKIWNN